MLCSSHRHFQTPTYNVSSSSMAILLFLSLHRLLSNTLPCRNLYFCMIKDARLHYQEPFIICYFKKLYLSLQVFEDENEAAKYCDLLQGGGQGCEGVAEIEASSVRSKIQPMELQHKVYPFRTSNNKWTCLRLQVFDLCRKMRALAVLFRRGRTPPLPQSLELNLKAKKRSLED